jgi:hypothetical protein
MVSTAGCTSCRSSCSDESGIQVVKAFWESLTRILKSDDADWADLLGVREGGVAQRAGI